MASALSDTERKTLNDSAQILADLAGAAALGLSHYLLLVQVRTQLAQFGTARIPTGLWDTAFEEDSAEQKRLDDWLAANKPA